MVATYQGKCVDLFKLLFCRRSRSQTLWRREARRGRRSWARCDSRAPRTSCRTATSSSSTTESRGSKKKTSSFGALSSSTRRRVASRRIVAVGTERVCKGAHMARARFLALRMRKRPRPAAILARPFCWRAIPLAVCRGLPTARPHLKTAPQPNQR